MTTRFGPRTQHVYTALRHRIVHGELMAGSKLPPHIDLAAAYGVAPLTMRQVLARLEAEGLVSREHGRGTFVRARVLPSVLIVEDDPAMGGLLTEYVTRAGHCPIAVTTPSEGLACLTQDPAITLIFSDVRLPDAASGIDFIRTVRRRWHTLPLVAVTGYPDDLAGLHGSPECPVLILPKPFWPQQIQETLRLALRG